MKKVRLKNQLGNRSDLSQLELKKHFNYNPVTGEFHRTLGFTSWCELRTCNELITSSNNRGYKWVRFRNKQFLVHRLIFLYMLGKHPDGEIDHIDGNRQNNKWVNLRDVSPFENSRNQCNRKDNKTGVRGVHQLTNGKWKARISHENIRYDLGTHKTKKEAVDVRLKAEKDFKYHPNHAKRDSWEK